MKQYIAFIFLTLIICWKPTPTSKGQDTMNKFLHKPAETAKKDTITEQIKILQKKNDSLRGVKKDLFHEEIKYQEQLANKKQKVIIKEVIIPVYVRADTLNSLDTSAINFTGPDERPKKKLGFLYKLFHHKKHKK